MFIDFLAFYVRIESKKDGDDSMGALNETAITPMTIKIDEIDATVINPIRKVDTTSEGYQILAKSIEKEGQLYPITVRKLNTDEQEAVADSKVKYGIIDGHHRFQIAIDNGKIEILANVDTSGSSEINDIILAFKLNNTNIRMTPAQRGEVIFKLIELYEKNGEKKSAGDIGKEIFGLQTAMAYRCLQAFKQASSKSEDNSKSINKCNLKKLYEAFDKLPTDSNFNFEHTEQYIEQLNAIKEIESQLRFYRKFLLSQPNVKEKIKKQKLND